MWVTAQRDYGGQSAAERVAERRRLFLDAGLELLGSVGAAGMTVRGAIRQAGLAPRYFYEEFGTLDALQVAVFDQVIGEVEVESARMILEAPADLRSRTRAGALAIVSILVDDPRKGRVLFVESTASPALAKRRTAETERFALLLLGYGVYQNLPGLAADGTASDAAMMFARFAVGGTAEVLGAAVQGTAVDRERLVDQLTELLLAAGEAFQRLA